MSKTLVVYYSRSGHTGRVAQALGRRLHADLDEIRLEHPRAGALGYVRCALEAIAQIGTRIQTKRDARCYDLIVVGTPVWYWSLSSPVRTYLKQVAGARANFAFFCTMDSSGSARVFKMMASLIGRPPIATMALTDQQVDAHASTKPEEFTHTLTGHPTNAAPPRPTGFETKAA